MQTFQYFIKEFRDKVDSPELEIRDLAMGIRGYGIFANVSRLKLKRFCYQFFSLKACKLYGTEEDVKFMFVGLIQRCEQIAMPTISLSQASDVFDERFLCITKSTRCTISDYYRNDECRRFFKRMVF